MKYYQTLVEKAKQGFKELSFSEDLKNTSLEHLKLWLKNDVFSVYFNHIAYLIEMKKWTLLLDSFCRVIPFGTGGRRGLVGIGPNRINVCTIKATAQGYSQYLIKNYANLAREKGIVLAYDVRECLLEGIDLMAPSDLLNTVNSFELAEAAAAIYAGNKIKVYIFESVRSTPTLSFAIRHLKAIGGCMFSASHNLPQYNGEKVYDYQGSQLVSPHDEAVSYEIHKFDNKLLETDIEVAVSSGLVQYIGSEIDHIYYDAVQEVSLSDERNVKILYSPLHGTGLTSVFPILLKLGFDVYLDKQTSNLSGNFENVTFNNPNPELKESFDGLIGNANLCGIEIIMSTDPDADRLGVMVRHENNWEFLNGNEIGIILTEYVLGNFSNYAFIKNKPLLIKTAVTASLITEIANCNNADCIDDLMVGFKYICEKINILEKDGLEHNFLLGIEESHGYLVGTYCRDKDASSAAVLIAELAAILKKDNLTLIDYINIIYSNYGYCYNYLTEIRLLGIKGVEEINHLMMYFRKKDIAYLGRFQIEKKSDRLEGCLQPHLSRSDISSRNLITFIIKNLNITKLIKLTIRPSGTEPKLKIYIEVFGLPFDVIDINSIKDKLINIRKALEVDFLKQCYAIIGVSLPERSFLLFDQIALYDKLKYFEIEKKITGLVDVENIEDRYSQMVELLSFLGANPINKVDPAFAKKYGCGILTYLGLMKKYT